MLNTLSGRLTVLLVGLTLTITLVSVVLVRAVFSGAADEFEQTKLEGAAIELAQQLRPALDPVPDYQSLRKIAFNATIANPALEIYFLSASGEVLGGFGHKGIATYQKTLPMQAIEAFIGLAGNRQFPLYGPDPNTGRMNVVFSAAPVTIEGAPGYVYVVLNSRFAESLRSLSLGHSGAGLTVEYLIATGTLAALAGIFLLRYLVRRFNSLAAVVRRFGDGNFSERIGDTSGDQIGLLSQTINSMAEKIESSIAALSEKDALRRKLIAHISHDLRSPLVSAKANLEMLTGRSGRSTEEAEMLKGVSQSFTALERLLQELFELARLEAREKLPELLRFDLEELFSDVGARISGAAEASGKRLEFSVADAPLFVHADPGMIGRVMQNLIENGLRFSRDGGTVRVFARRSGTGAEIRVEDDGIGIPPEDLQKIFEPFGRAGNNSESERVSTGLGLAIVQRILELHRCSITVESRPGSGSVFSFTLGA